MKKKILTVGLLALGAAFVIAGVATGQHMSVFGKAIFVCLECIGIG